MRADRILAGMVKILWLAYERYLARTFCWIAGHNYTFDSRELARSQPDDPDWYSLEVNEYIINNPQADEVYCRHCGYVLTSTRIAGNKYIDVAARLRQLKRL